MSLLESSKISVKLLLANLSASVRKKAFCCSLRHLSRTSLRRDSIAVGCGLSSAIKPLQLTSTVVRESNRSQCPISGAFPPRGSGASIDDDWRILRFALVAQVFRSVSTAHLAFVAADRPFNLAADSGLFFSF